MNSLFSFNGRAGRAEYWKFSIIFCVLMMIAGFIDGSALNASNLSSGTVPDARFPSALPAIDGSALTVAGTLSSQSIASVFGLQTTVHDYGTWTMDSFNQNIKGLGLENVIQSKI